jgi:hypothetical protein
MLSFEEVWTRIKSLQGEEFRTITGRTFTYSIERDALVPFRTAVAHEGGVKRVNRNLSRVGFERAFRLVPLADTNSVRRFQGPSYLYAILMDDRVRQQDW